MSESEQKSDPPKIPVSRCTMRREVVTFEAETSNDPDHFAEKLLSEFPIEEVLTSNTEPEIIEETEKRIRITVPAFLGQSDSDSVLTNLYSCCETAPNSCCIELDLSKVQKVPIFFLGALSECQHDMVEREVRIEIILNRKTALPRGLKEKLISKFDLVFVD